MTKASKVYLGLRVSGRKPWWPGAVARLAEARSCWTAGRRSKLQVVDRSGASPRGPTTPGVSARVRSRAGPRWRPPRRPTPPAIVEVAALDPLLGPAVGDARARAAVGAPARLTPANVDCQTEVRHLLLEQTELQTSPHRTLSTHQGHRLPGFGNRTHNTSTRCGKPAGSGRRPSRYPRSACRQWPPEACLPLRDGRQHVDWTGGRTVASPFVVTSSPLFAPLPAGQT